VEHDKHAGHNPNMFKQKFWLSLILTIPTLIFSHTVQGWFGLNWMFPESEYIPAFFGVIIFFYGGVVFLKSARTELASKQPGMMTLISMAISVAFIYSLASTFKLVSGMDFWWELATLVTIMLLGHWLEMASVQSAQGALKELAKLLPDEVERITDDSTQKVQVSDLKIHDHVLVRPGSHIPADGTVIRGESEVNESMLTGESHPIAKKSGAAVIGGTVNGSGSLTVEITKVGDETALAGIMKLVAEAQSSKSKTQVLADKAAFYLTFIAIGAAILTAVIWAIAGQSAGFILERVVTVLVIACPHALGLAIPLVTAIATTKAAKNGLLVRERMALEAARSIDVILFDKTGTLTKGEQGVVDVIAEGDNEALALAAAVESESEHPIARAIVAKAKKRQLQVPTINSFISLAGRGAKAVVSNKEIYVGSPRLLEELSIEPSQNLQNATKQASTEGKTVVYIMTRSEGALGAIMLADVIRETSKEAVAELSHNGKRVAMLTGDSEGVAAWVARELGIKEYFAEVLPGHKADAVKKLQADGSRVAMVGDGVNDAPALTQADIGIAIGAGTDVAIESAGIILASNDPRGVAKIVTLSKVAYRKMLQNLAWAAGYNVIAIPLAAGITAAWGFILSPAFGAILMSLSTIIVALNAQLLRGVKLSEEDRKNV
jgi:Cu2+-exporting ATPase